MNDASLLTQQAALRRAIVDGGASPGVVGRLRIYQNAYRARLRAALRDNFGSVPRVLGDDAFDALADAYIDAHPSTHASIRWFGDRLPAFMAARDDLVPHAALTDLARMEWALRGAFDAADAEPLVVADLTALAPDAWPALCFAPMPGLQLLALDWNVGPVWRALQGDSQHEPELAEPEALAHTVLVWRHGLTPRWRALDARAAWLLRQALDGVAFGELCALAASELGDVGDAAAARVAAALRGWVDDGLLLLKRA